MAEAVGVYGPLFAVVSAVPVILLVGATLLNRSRVSLSTVLLFVGVATFGALISIGLATSAVFDALRKGVYVTGQVLSTTGGKVTFRVPLRGQDVTISYTPRNANFTQAGEYVDLLVDPNTQKLLMVVGAATN